MSAGVVPLVAPVLAAEGDAVAMRNSFLFQPKTPRQIAKSSIMNRALIALYPGKFISSRGTRWPSTTNETISSGTARKAPIGPHSQVQNTSARNTRNGLIVSRRPTMLGVMKWPSTVAIATNSAGASAA